MNLSLPLGLADLDVKEFGGAGRPVLLLHGGAGPFSVIGFAQLLAAQGAHVLVPVHPGFDGTPRPDGLTDPAGLAELYLALLDQRDLHNVAVVGNSIGGWIASEMALRGSDRISRLVLVNAVGVEVPGEPVTDIAPLSPAELSKLSFHDPVKFAIDPAALTDQQRANAGANRATLLVYGNPMTDPKLLDRLAAVTVPSLVLWGESDQVVTPAYGRAFAAAIPGAGFTLLPGSGHVPQIETPEQLLTPLWTFITADSGTETGQ
jgi:pimeloyl-ACP methyl ester carboxylesterase